MAGATLSERMLWEWCNYFIDLCDDQVSFVLDADDIPIFLPVYMPVMED